MITTPQIQFASFIKIPIEKYLSRANEKYALSLITGQLERPADRYDSELIGQQYCPEYRIRTALGNQQSRLADGLPTVSIEYFGTTLPIIYGGSNVHDHQFRLKFASSGSEANDESAVENLRDYIVWVLFEGLVSREICFVVYQLTKEPARTNVSLVQWSSADNVFYCSATIVVGLHRFGGQGS
jgi:hypothetical protein